LRYARYGWFGDCIDCTASIAVNAVEARLASLTIRKLDEDIKSRLRLSAARHGVSMEEEARRRLRESLSEMAPKRPTVQELLQFSVKPAIPFDQKKASDELSDEGLL
jgi:antitoxin FitA